ncbi:MAG: hypothetical protein DKM50_13985 [Candidatus Margulisiibacteriota bacterium]|nr:MAG: hypothetical protein A2X43_01145 [Candidatus Margulisbacteria bacterium GWD2_39_127]OGI03326.1 MAG: hypothetical protein A2X42_06930 [Candidatus Margulisbacteria bacterium GWF2_38_17]OGI12010.1 MAG: hypothetical protein A2X41_03010 [Candidatus Margulisbacteria bacterium GWE2_39_32]PZM77043.1 MAG: hypothetical protein DKM50_13985 [Candidatus Margulisiibacteriota bacterium]HAR63176.1 hypothetical protein [Candidatus Margulisiibacteriota bacterium]
MTLEKLYYTGDIIFKEGDLSGEIYLVKAGCVQIFQLHHGKEVEITKLYSGDIFGELAVLDNSYRSATARVVEDALISIIPKEVIAATLKSNPIWVNALIRVLTTRLREMTKKYNEQISEYHPFKYLNYLIKKKLELGTPTEKIVKELSIFLNDPEYKQLKSILQLITKSG